MTTFNYQ